MLDGDGVACQTSLLNVAHNKIAINPLVSTFPGSVSAAPSGAQNCAGFIHCAARTVFRGRERRSGPPDADGT